MTALTDALDRIMNWLQINQPEVANSFLPGLTAEEIRAGEEKIGFKLPEEIYKLYQWRNGSTEAYSFFLPSIAFLPFDEAIRVSQEDQDFIAHFSEEELEQFK